MMPNSGHSSLTLIFRRISLLIWKNFLFQKRHYIVTALEILLPTLFAIFLAVVKSRRGNGDSWEKVFPEIFDELDEADLIGVLIKKLHFEDFVFAYAPHTALASKVIAELQSVLNGTRLEWKGFNTEHEIEAYNLRMAIGNRTATLKGAVIFLEGFDGDDFIDSQNFHYKLRFTNSLAYTSELFPFFPMPGPNFYNEIAYSDQGFSGLQVLIDKFIIKSLIGNGATIQEISVQAFPYPPYLQSLEFQQLFNLLMPSLLCLGFVFIVPSVVRGVVGEKESGIKELLKMMGLPNWMHWLGWMMNSLLLLVFSITIVTFLLFFPFDAAVGGVVEHSDPTLWWVVLLLYCMASIAFCFFMSSLFQKPTIATTVGFVLWLLSYFGLALQISIWKYESLNAVEKVALCLIPNVAMTFAIKVMGGLEGKVGARWSNLFEPMSAIDSLSVGIIMLMMICSIAILISLTIYFENILPSSYGVRRPWYYIFQRVPKSKVSSSYGKISRPPSGVLNPGFEEDPCDIPPGVEICKLTKHFGSKVAVDDMTLKMFHGQITALLGQNGAGKTTTMSMLTGMIAPTSGVAIVNGRNISTNLEGVRHDLGLCPQHNMLFDELTVGEHLMFFGRLKGLTCPQAHSEMVELLKKLQLSDKMDTPTMTLSGGQKRKLNLGMALIGGSKVVFLDEPTSGMDPEARRAVWDLLLEMKEHRTIALTAHSMEEVDVLGDRIAIMAKGKVQCCGSPMFLKRFYGAGYTLRMTVDSAVPPDVILSTLQKHIENASFKYQHAPNPSEIAFTLPADANTTSKFPEMFSELSKDRNVLGIEAIGLSPTTMDEVFTKVGELSEEDVQDDAHHSSSKSRRSFNNMQTNRLSGLRLARQQFYALFLKRMLYTSRKKKLFISQLVIPVLLIIMAIIACNLIYQPNDADPPLKMSLSSYNKPITAYTTTDDEMGNIFAQVVGSSASMVSNNNSLEDELLVVAEQDLPLYRERYIVGAELSASHIKAMFSTIPSHGSPLAINLASNTILRKLAPGENLVIEISAQPMKSVVNDFMQAAKPKPFITPIISLMFAMILPLGLALLASSFLVFPSEERLCKAKQLQLMTGVNPLIFWVSSLLWDFLLAIGVVCVMVACFPIFQSYGNFTAYGGGGVLLVILVVFSFTAINFSYLFSLLPASVGVGFSLLTILHVYSGTYLYIFIFVMELSGFISEANIIRPLARLFPTFGAAMCIKKFMEIATRNIRCDLISKEAMAILCNPGNQIEDQLRSCCKFCTKLFPTAPCFEPEPYLVWSSIKLPDNPEKLLSYNENDFVIPGICQELMWLFLVGVMYLFLLIAVEFGVIKRILSVVFSTESSIFQGVVQDVDVMEETVRVQDMVASGNNSADAIMVKNLSKNYGSFAAVSNISFGVHHGECFGLLGVNGAGKTTTFRMLTGDEVRSSGNAFTSSSNLDTDRRSFLANIGYCPQFDGIIGVLTGKEMLELFCRLRGVDSALIHSEAMRWLGNLGLTSSANVQCQKYSGGMKRRLSAAMALIGDPPVILLDEPTSGVDPMARRNFWKVISSVRDSGQAVILTSHSMEECEALCSRLGIMVNGQMQCLGGVQHLKNKFAQGYSLILKLRSMVSSDVASDVDVLSYEITTKFHPCTLKEQNQNVLQYQILNKRLPWEFLFQTMEDLKRDYGDIIEEYSLNETTLEEVFLSFARKQYPNRQVDLSFLKKVVTSNCFLSCHSPHATIETDLVC